MERKSTHPIYSLGIFLISSAVGFAVTFFLFFSVFHVKINLNALKWILIYGIITGNMIGFSISVIDALVVQPKIGRLPKPLDTVLQVLVYLVTSMFALVLFMILLTQFRGVQWGGHATKYILIISGIGGGIGLIVSLIFSGYEYLRGELEKSYEKLKEKELLEKELEMAREVQKSFLPQGELQIKGFEVSTFLRSARQVGGDYYGILPFKDKVGIAIGDVSGKGMPAALVMSNLHATLHALAEDHPLDDLIFKINNSIYKNTSSYIFVTFFCGFWDCKTGELKYINAGHDAPVIIRQDGSVNRLKEGGMILGVSPDIAYQIGSVILNSKDLLLLYTDGVTEAGLPHINPWGEANLIDHLKEIHLKPTGEILKSILINLEKTTEGIEQTDDITMILLKRD